MSDFLCDPVTLIRLPCPWIFPRARVLEAASFSLQGILPQPRIEPKISPLQADPIPRATRKLYYIVLHNYIEKVIKKKQNKYALLISTTGKLALEAQLHC